MVEFTIQPLAVANAFIERHGKNSDLTHMKLQKLVFFADGWKLGFNGEPLTGERPQVWRYGPVFKSLYNMLTRFGNNPIKEPYTRNPLNQETPIIGNDESDNSRLIDWIWKKYSLYTAMQLSEMTHAPGTPWRIMAEKYNFKVPLNLAISDDIMRTYFQKLAYPER